MHCTLYACKHVLSNMLYKSMTGWTFKHVGIDSMRFSTLRYKRELVTQFVWLWAMIHGILSHLKEEYLGALFYSYCNMLETSM